MARYNMASMYNVSFWIIGYSKLGRILLIPVTSLAFSKKWRKDTLLSNIETRWRWRDSNQTQLTTQKRCWGVHTEAKTSD